MAIYKRREAAYVGPDDDKQSTLVLSDSPSFSNMSHIIDDTRPVTRVMDHLPGFEMRAEEWYGRFLVRGRKAGAARRSASEVSAGGC